MSSGQGVVIADYARVRRTIKKLNPEADKQFKVAMRELGDEVVKRAKAEAIRKKLVGEGKDRSRPTLVKGIKRGSITMDRSEIKSTAFRTYEAPSQRGPYQRQRNRSGELRRSYVGRDFVYPAVYEYGGRGQNLTGPRAFLNPALMKSRDYIQQTFLEAVEKAALQAGFK